jgi:hypothetical protein
MTGLNVSGEMKNAGMPTAAASIRILPVVHHINPSLTVIDPFKRVTEEQVETSKHTLYVDRKVEERLSEEDRKGFLLPYRQIFNWVPFLRRLVDPNFQQYDTVRHVKTRTWNDLGLAW